MSGIYTAKALYGIGASKAEAAGSPPAQLKHHRVFAFRNGIQRLNSFSLRDLCPNGVEG
jgi:hypothetical protein